MLIIAIPKSASTSLLKTLSVNHSLKGNQVFFRNHSIPAEYSVLAKYHSDIREMNENDINIFYSENELYKQHIPPTANNISLLIGRKKVILLRNPRDIIMAYFRAEKKLLHNRREEFKFARTESDWLNQAESNGLINQLNEFYNGWLNCEDEKLIIYYDQLINDPKSVINSIENYHGLKLTEHPIVLAKERYSRITMWGAVLIYIKKIIVKSLLKLRGIKQ